MAAVRQPASLLAHQWAHPGKQLVFMGGELAQEREWSHDRSLDWHLLEQPEHLGVQTLVRELNRQYGEQPSLWELDSEPAGFSWLAGDDVDQNVIAYLRFSPRPEPRAGLCRQPLTGRPLRLPARPPCCGAMV